ncbi:hypothetical protein E1264_29735 [Actinomadura sp. KC216]|uniref:GAF domain-containing protein n=1 Tax=Actinomadura sp. KC216 TaxID=2530370 RepID=UPI0010504549|nr:GAF domain-containing protein [Actinomadura sp. KC216]TDB83102.1 hypothetical protein E1264_29735 [Actinomadura sp. KC216]
MNGNDPAATGWWPPSLSRGADNGPRVAASFDLMAAVLDGIALPDLLIRVADRARAIADVPLTFIALPTEDAFTLRIDIAVGADSDRVRGLTVRRGRSMLGRAFSSRRALSARIVADQTLSALPAGPILILPLDTGEATLGVLAALGRPGAEPFSPSAARQLLLFADTSARLVQLAEDQRTATPRPDPADERIITLHPPLPRQM